MSQSAFSLFYFCSHSPSNTYQVYNQKLTERAAERKETKNVSLLSCDHKLLLKSNQMSLFHFNMISDSLGLFSALWEVSNVQLGGTFHLCPCLRYLDSAL